MSTITDTNAAGDGDVDFSLFRRNVGVCVVSQASGLVLGAQRHDSGCDTWQMPQGGVDEDEEPQKAALRELEEETAIRSAHIVGSIDGWLTYDFPTKVRARLHGGWEHYRGQAQKWYLILFTGQDSEINLDTVHKEFKSWCWMPLDALPAVVADFKRPVYTQVAAAFLPRIQELQRQGVIGRAAQQPAVAVVAAAQHYGQSAGKN